MRFVRVREKPQSLNNGEYVIEAPTFLNEVLSCSKKKPRNGVMSINYLRELVSAVGLKYLPETFNPLTDVNVSSFRGVPCSSDDEANRKLIQLFKRSFPDALDAYVDFHIKNRPNGTHTIYFLGGGQYSSVFLKNGFHEVLLKDLKSEDKPKKVVGKPAVTEKVSEKTDTVV